MVRTSSIRTRTWRLVTVVSTIALLVGSGALPSAAGAASPQPTAWKAKVGAQTSDMSVQANAFLPRDISVNVGDTITWTVATGEFHTVSFLSGGAPPPLIIPGDQFPIQVNPAATLPAGGSPYSGSDFFSSGLLLKSGTYTLGFGAAGDFDYVCLVHAEMKGTVHVSKAGTPYPKTQSQYDQQARVQALGLLGIGLFVGSQGLSDALKGGRSAVTAGIGRLLPGVEASLAVVRFEPGQRVVHVNDTVTFTNLDPEFPHTVTFGDEPTGPGGQLQSFFPSGAIDSPGHATLGAPGQSVNSGFLGAGVPFGTTFQVKFSNPGTYTYICALHDDLGMKGTIQVLP